MAFNGQSLTFRILQYLGKTAYYIRVRTEVLRLVSKLNLLLKKML